MNVMRCVLSRNLMNEETLTRVGPQGQERERERERKSVYEKYIF